MSWNIRHMGVNANGTKEIRENHPPLITEKGKTMKRMSTQAMSMKQKYHSLREGATEGRGGDTDAVQRTGCGQTRRV